MTLANIRVLLTLTLPISLAIASLIVSGCVNLEPYKVQRSLAGEQLAASFELTSVPFFPQESYQCGPSALATLIEAIGAQTMGYSVTPEELARSVYLPERQGSLQPLLVAKARDYGLPYVRQGEGLEALFAEVKAGKPVLILQNLGVGFAPNWHYAVVVGWDAEKQKVILRSGQKARQLHSLKFLEYTWRASDYWSLSLYTPADTPAPHAESAWIKAASGLEETEQFAAARQAYAQIVAAYPNSFLGYMGLGNTAYRLEDYPAAADAYAAAIGLTENPEPAHHNLAWALIRLENRDAAHQHAEIAAMDRRYIGALEELKRRPESP